MHSARRQQSKTRKRLVESVSYCLERNSLFTLQRLCSKAHTKWPRLPTSGRRVTATAPRRHNQQDRQNTNTCINMCYRSARISASTYLPVLGNWFGLKVGANTTVKISCGNVLPVFGTCCDLPF